MPLQFNKNNFALICDSLAEKDPQLKSILKEHGHPPMWTRSPSFATLIHIILEQQVSLASAKAAFNKLKEKIGFITPKKLLQLSDKEMRACYFSCQKTVYTRCLANAILNKELSLKRITASSDEEIKTALKKIKGIGDWTADVYLLFALQRSDIFPTGDLAMLNAFKEIKNLPKQTSKDEIIRLAESWRPHRSIATMLLWHHYIKTRNIKF